MAVLQESKRRDGSKAFYHVSIPRETIDRLGMQKGEELETVEVEGRKDVIILRRANYDKKTGTVKVEE